MRLLEQPLTSLSPGENLHHSDLIHPTSSYDPNFNFSDTTSAPPHAAEASASEAARKTVHEMWEMLLPLLVATLLFFGILAAVHAALTAAGMRCWFDEEQMQGDINKQMTKGIDGSAVIVAFITSRYVTKVNGDGPNGEDDNCAPPSTPHTRVLSSCVRPNSELARLPSQASSSSTTRCSARASPTWWRA